MHEITAFILRAPAHNDLAGTCARRGRFFLARGRGKKMKAGDVAEALGEAWKELESYKNKDLCL